MSTGYRKSEQAPASEEILDLGNGVIRMQLPIAMPGLRHVNMYGLLDDRGLAIIDVGVPGPMTWKAVQKRLKDAGFKVTDVHTVLVTHSHPDHFGCAGRLVTEANAQLVTHNNFRLFWNDKHGQTCNHGDTDMAHDESLTEGNPFTEPNPWDGQSHQMGPPRGRRLMYRLMRSRMFFANYKVPDPARRVRNGDVIRLAGRDMFAVHTPGHTLDHLCIHDPEAGQVFTGDHVLPHITPYISGLAGGTNPLLDYFASLERTAALPDVTRALPAHGIVIDEPQTRCREIIEHHEERFNRLRKGSLELGKAASVRELSQFLFHPDKIGPMADGECYAHLEYLRLAGRADVRTEHETKLYEVTA
ncbi:MAG TPA: MBL fold metallo-hydrolase [Acidimicrobiales bacterium]|nr:MBL fold metallo-hydrolase [Acidimicrobiales bacterium]